MSLPTTDSIFNEIRIVDFSIQYPMSNFDDNVTKIYSYRCQVKADSYSTLATGASMSSAASAGVISIPFINSLARFVHDTAPVSISGGFIEFIRVFSMIPKSFVDYSSGVYTTQPTYSTRQTVILYSTVNGDPLRVRKTYPIQDASKTETVAARVEYSFTTNPAQILTKTIEGFQIDQDEPSISDGTYFGNQVTIEDEGQINVTTTGDIGVLEGTKIRKWKGDIYEISTIYKL